jgi:hypothetical protein
MLWSELMKELNVTLIVLAGVLLAPRLEAKCQQTSFEIEVEVAANDSQVSIEAFVAPGDSKTDVRRQASGFVVTVSFDPEGEYHWWSGENCNRRVERVYIRLLRDEKIVDSAVLDVAGDFTKKQESIFKAKRILLFRSKQHVEPSKPRETT